MRTKPVQLSVFAVAALAIVAVAAVMLLAGGVPAQAGSLPTMKESVTNAPPQEEEAHAQPDACPETPVRVFNSGRLALFDAYWYQGSDPQDKETLEINPCPPTITHVPADPGVPPSFGDPGRPATDARDDRDPSPTVNIASTVIHIPNDYKETLSFNATTERTKYPFMFDEWNRKDTDNDGTDDALHHNHVWVLPTCDPSYTDAQNTANPARAGDDDLCLIFSAALLDADHWRAGINDTAEGPVQFEFESEREKLVAPSERGQLFAFYPYNDIPSGNARDQVTWSTDDTNDNALVITPETYEYRQWAFSEPGTYVIQVHVKGHPNPEHHAGKTVTSTVRRYIFHVGTLADLGAAVEFTDTAGDSITEAAPGDTVKIKVKATNAGPDDAPSTMVNVELPVGLTYVSHDAPTGTTYDHTSNPGWNLGKLAKPADLDADPVQPTEKTLTITATVDQGTRGHKLSAGATIFATETIGATVVPVLDPNPGNNSGLASITSTEVANTPAEWYLRLSVEENSQPGTAVGDIICLRDPDPDDSLFYYLTGEGADNFGVFEASGGVQIAVASGASLDYEVTPAYELKLHVSDGVDEHGNPDGSPRVVDDTVSVRIDIDDVDDPPAVRLTINDVNPTVGDEITLTAELLNGDHLQDVEYVYYSVTTDENGLRTSYAEARTDRNTHSITRTTAQTEDFFVKVIGHIYDPASVVRVDSNTVTVTWQEAPPPSQ